MSLPAAFLRDAQQLIPQERRFDDPLSTLAFGTDASFYRLIPKLVIRVESEDEVALSDRLQALLKDEDLCLRLGARAHEVARQRFMPAEVAAKTVEAYRKALE